MRPATSQHNLVICATSHLVAKGPHLQKGLVLGTLTLWRCFPQVPPNRRQESQCRRAAPLFLWQCRLAMSSVGARLIKNQTMKKGICRKMNKCLPYLRLLNETPFSSGYLLTLLLVLSLSLSLWSHSTASPHCLQAKCGRDTPWFLWQTSQ